MSMDKPPQRDGPAGRKECGYSFFFLYNLLIIGLLVYTQIKLHISDERFQAYQESNTARFDNLERRLEQCEMGSFKPQPGEKKLAKNEERREVVSENKKVGLDALLKLKQGPAGPPGAPGIQGPPGKDGRDAANIAAITHLINSTVNRLVSDKIDKAKQQAVLNPSVSGTSYVRWGRTVCPNMSSFIYQGRAAGQYFTENGGSSQYLCMPDEPEFSVGATASITTHIYGVEYYESNHLKGVSGSTNNVPCVLCQTSGRTSKVVVPARLNCPNDSWSKEYSGFLMTEGVGTGHNGRTEYLCVDADAETIPGMIKSEYGSLLYFVGATCQTGSRSGNLGSCPPYKESAPITCTVCSK